MDWHIEPGQRWALLGGNGSGKSTLLRLLAAAEDPTEGRIERHGSVSWPLAFGGGFQGGLTGADNLRFIARLYGVEEDSALRRAQDFAQLGPYLHEPYMTYSSGMRARLAFAASLMVRFDCLLIDEIVAVGDASFRQRCEVELRRLCEQSAMVMATHIMDFVHQYCTHVAVLEDGRLRLFDNVKAGCAHYERLIAAAA
ncbi:MAG: ATP-binding cassette domain-containing protein [Rhodocyclaceae bacterium]|nr:ATP-binding cassette domain-containing protein [Rhodocyclaceae bacterium]